MYIASCYTDSNGYQTRYIVLPLRNTFNAWSSVTGILEGWNISLNTWFRYNAWWFKYNVKCWYFEKCINFVLKYLGTIYDGIFLAFLANKCRSTHQCFGTSLIDLKGSIESFKCHYIYVYQKENYTLPHFLYNMIDFKIQIYIDKGGRWASRVL